MINDIKIIFEDEDVVVINKPANLVCNRAESVVGETLQDWNLKHSCLQKGLQPLIADTSATGQVEKEFWDRSGLLHRLDKNTSGVMVLAKNAKTFGFIKKQFMERKTKKKYLALVHGNLQPKVGSINLPIKRSVLNRHKFVVNVEGKMARTKYQVIQEYRMQNVECRRKGDFSKEKLDLYSLVEVELLTGRTHQIRVHFTHLGYPLVSDENYLGKRLKDDLLWCPRIFLHAKYLGFTHPKGEFMEFEAELSEDLESALNFLGKL